MNTNKLKTKMLSFQQKDNLAVVQFATEPNNTLEIVTLTFALQNKLIEVTEVNDGGSVNELLVINSSDKFVFMMDGDILDGAKQNRVLNTSVLLAPQKKTVIPVSCVESGRWRYKSANFQPTDYVAPSKMRADKSERVSASLSYSQKRDANQSEVWDNVSKVSKSLNVVSESSNLSDVFDGSKSSYQKFLDSFTHHPEANGAIFFISKKPLSMDIFNDTEMMKEYYPKLIKGVALDVHGLKNTAGEMTEAEGFYKTGEFIDLIEPLEKKEYSGVSLGVEKRFSSETVSGFELSYNGHVVHMTALSLGTK